jgi:allantoinase
VSGVIRHLFPTQRVVSAFDLIVRQDGVVRVNGVSVADGGVRAGTVAVIADAREDAARSEIDAARPHRASRSYRSNVHCNERRRPHGERFSHATRALAAGGATTFFDMPLNSAPPTIDGESFDRKLEAARASSVPRQDAVPTFREPTRMEAMP